MRYGATYHYHRPAQNYNRTNYRGAYRGGHRGGYHRGGYNNSSQPSPYQIDLRSAPANTANSFCFKCPIEDEDFDFSTFRTHELNYHVTDLQLERFKIDLNAKSRPRSRFSSLLVCLVFLSGLLLTASFITILIVGILYVSNSSTPPKYTNAVTTYSSTKLYAKQNNNAGLMVGEFITGLITNIITGMITLVQGLISMQKHTTKMRERRKKYLQEVCRSHTIHNFGASKTCTIELTVSTQGSYICMKITPKPTDLL